MVDINGFERGEGVPTGTIPDSWINESADLVVFSPTKVWSS